MQSLRLSVCLIAVLSSVVLGLIWRFSMDMIIAPTYPRLELATASNSRNSHEAIGSVVSLSRDGKWIHGEKEMRTENELRSALTKRGEVVHGLGSIATISVRIGKDAPAKHFLEINRIATECGYDQMLVSVVRPKRITGRF
jgi:hypothetical protein